MNHCDICKIEFPSCDPSREGATAENSWKPAKIDAKVRGIGCWGYLCETHESLAVPGTATAV